MALLVLKSCQRAVMGRLGLWLAAAREGFTLLMPLTVLSVSFTILGNLPHGGWTNLFPTDWLPYWDLMALKIQSATAGVMGLALAMTVGNRLYILLVGGNYRHSAAVFTSVQCLVNFIACIVPLSQRQSLSQVLGYQSLFLGIVVGVVTVESLELANKIRPDKQHSFSLDGNPLFRQAMKQVLPSVVSTLLALVVVYCLNGSASDAMQGMVYALSAAPHWFWQAEILTPILVLTKQLLWSIGMHGGNLVEVQLGWMIAPNQVLYEPSLATSAVMNAFAHLGGSGSTVGLIVALVIAGKDHQLKRLGYLSVLPALVNVNELLLFGVPLILNPIMFLPFVLAPLATLGIALLAHQWGWMPLAGVPANWNTPIFLSGYLVSAGWSGVVVQGLGVAASAAIYLPFLRKLEALRRENQARALKPAILAFASPEVTTTSLLNRPGYLGDFARALHSDFERDLGTERVYQVYQPKHDRSGKVCGVEALLRWNHAIHGHINPAAIVNIAEESALINRIGEWTLDAACASYMHWKSLGYQQLKISVNLSPAQLEDPHCVRIVHDCLERHQMDARELELEITEGRSISNSDQSELTLSALTAMGVHLSMDDFGMGFTSLFYMQRFAVSAIKIDGSLTRTVLTNKVNADVIRTIAILGANQGAQVVAEFVDNAPQQALLSELGCSEFQGYFYSPPVRAEEFVQYLQKHL